MKALKDRTLAFIDCETTGLDPTVHEVIEYAVILEEPDGTFQEFTAKVTPEYIERAHPRALEVNGYTPEKWVGSVPSVQAAQEIGRLLSGDVVLVGHNVRFDSGFFTEMLKRAGVNVRIDYHTVDTITLAWEHLVPKGLTSLSLANVCKFLSVTPGGHEALADARACRTVYHMLMCP